MGIISKIFKVLFPPTEYIKVAETTTNTIDYENIQERTSKEGNFTIVLEDTGNYKIQVIKIIKEMTNLGLKESKDIADNTPAPIKENIDETTALKFKRELESVGAKINLIRNDD